MKKHNLFKVIVLTFLAVVVLTWIFPAGGYSSGEFASSGRTPLGLFDLVRTPLIAFANLTQYAFILLVIGGFYGVLNKTGAYNALVEKWANKGNGKSFLVIMITILAILESLTGATFALVLLVPFFAAIVLKKGYGKVTAMGATIGAILLGDMAATLNYNVIGYLNEYMGTELLVNLIPSAILLLMSIAIYSFIVVKTAKIQMVEIEEEIEVEEKVSPKKKEEKTSKTSKTTKTTKTSKTETKAETKGKKDVKEVKVVKKKIKKIRKEIAPVEIPLLEKDNVKKGTGALTAFLVLLVTFVLVAMFNWNATLGVTFFEELHSKILATEIAGIPIFDYILGTVTPIGSWTNYDLIMIVVLSIPVIAWIYNVKIDEMIDGFAKGAAKMAKPAFYVMLATVLYASMFSSTTGDNIFYTFVNALFGSKEKVNLVMSGIISGTGSILFSDFQSLVGTLYLPYATVFAEYMPVATYILQTIYGIVAFVSPCGILLVLGLSFFNISWKEWFKYIWKFLVSAAIIVGVTIVSLVFIIPKVAKIGALSKIITAIEKIKFFSGAGAATLVALGWIVVFVIIAFIVMKKCSKEEA